MKNLTIHLISVLVFASITHISYAQNLPGIKYICNFEVDDLKQIFPQLSAEDLKKIQTNRASSWSARDSAAEAEQEILAKYPSANFKNFECKEFPKFADFSDIKAKDWGFDGYLAHPKWHSHYLRLYDNKIEQYQICEDKKVITFVFDTELVKDSTPTSPDVKMKITRVTTGDECGFTTAANFAEGSQISMTWIKNEKNSIMLIGDERVDRSVVTETTFDPIP